MMLPQILGVGIDIVEVKRIKRLIRRQKTFLSRVFTEAELRYSIGKKNQFQRLAVRFAAKEAVWKALGLKGLALKSIAIVKSPGGRPGILCKDPRAEGVIFHLALSHADDYASAAAVAVKNVECA
ncbi:MAG: holo-ACP synthase [Elusimicrobiales bacterium]|nr:holo-ACP synthase [Elusimicrobiales bacterium]